VNTFATALAPILALIMLGYGLKRTQFLPEAAWAGMEKLTYFILFPALLIHTLGRQTLGGSPWPSILFVVSMTLVVSALVLVFYYRLRPTESPATFTSIFQGGIRFNTYIALSIAQGLFGISGLALSSVAAGFMIVLINLFCIAAFAVWGKAGLRGIAPFIRTIVGNPLIIGCAIGWFLSLTGIGLPGVSDNISEVIGRAALPFGLLAVGAALRPRTVHGHVNAIIISCLVQFGVKPLTAALLIHFTGLNGIAAGVVLIAFMTPTASSSYILARQLGGDTEAMASIISFQTLLAFLVMPLLSSMLLTGLAVHF